MVFFCFIAYKLYRFYIKKNSEDAIIDGEYTEVELKIKELKLSYMIILALILISKYFR